MKLANEVKDKTLSIQLTGHIDSTNAAEVEEEIGKITKKKSYESLAIDMESLEYISSAGLRILLRLNNANKGMKLINVPTSVYEILEMTGFTEILTIEKAYRVFSVDGCEIIGRGANGIVYRLDKETIIKVYFKKDALPEIQRERDLARKAFVLGIPTAIPYDVVKVGDGYGSVFELLNAKSFAKILIADPSKIDELVKLNVELLKKLHETEVKPGDMPNIKEEGIKWAEYLVDYLPKDKYEKLVTLIKSIPDDHKMIHGDCHIKNIMIQNGETLLIDMDTLSYGNKIFEFSSIYLAYIGFGAVDHDNILEFLGIPYELANEFFYKLMRLYYNDKDESYINSVIEKSMIIGFTRLMRRTIKRIGFDDPKGAALIEYTKQQIITLVDKFDTLEF